MPYRHDDSDLAGRYESALTGSSGLTLVPLDVPLLRTAAELRTRVAIKTPDALQLAAALHTSCVAFLTDDRRLPEIPGLAIYQLSSFISN